MSHNRLGLDGGIAISKALRASQVVCARPASGVRAVQVQCGWDEGGLKVEAPCLGVGWRAAGGGAGSHAATHARARGGGGAGARLAVLLFPSLRVLGANQGVALHVVLVQLCANSCNHEACCARVFTGEPCS